jgi:hypothetical protein
MNTIRLILGLFVHSDVVDWPKLAFCLFALGCMRLTGIALAREVVLYFEGIAIRVDIDGSLSLNFNTEVLLADVYGPLPSGKVVFDVGANCGLFALQRCRRNIEEKVFCLEPHPLTFQRMQKTLH